MLQSAGYQSKTLSIIFFSVDCTTFNPIAHFGIPSVGLTEDEIPSKQPLASAAAFKVTLQYLSRPVHATDGSPADHPGVKLCVQIQHVDDRHTISFQKGVANQNLDHPRASSALWRKPLTNLELRILLKF